jgi:glucose-1-phosphate cytidylyltransferase
MVEIGGKPILWHIIKGYAASDFSDFVVALGYKGDYIKRWMVDCASLTSDVTIDMRTGGIGSHRSAPEEWRVTLIDTGQRTGTGGRIRKLAPYLGPGTFMMTWGDGLSDIDYRALLEFHRSHGKLATLTAVRPPARFGHLTLDGQAVREFTEKPPSGDGWVNGAFFVLEQEVVDYITDDSMMFEKEPLERLAKDGQLMAYQHEGFWQCMDTLRDRVHLERLWEAGDAPWKVWAE